ncbi:MAG: RNA polymerase-binding protein DksA [Pseudomonadota bacterium]
MVAKKKTVAKSAADADTAVKEQPAAKAKKKAVAKTKATAKKKVAAKAASAADKDDTSTAKKKVARKATAKKAVAKKAVAKKKSATQGAPTSIAGAVPTASGGQFKTFVPYEPTKGEEYMSPEQTEHFRAILLDWKVSLMQEVDRTVGHMKSDATNFPDPNDRATQEEEFSLELRTRDRERKLIKKIDESLTKLDEEDYGYCDGCGVEIGIRRLEARPTANMCIECKTLEEIREKQIA